jgi:hypothetical protein
MINNLLFSVRKLLLLTVLSIFSSSLHAKRGDTLIVSGDIVNLHARPSTSSQAFKQLEKNSKVIEISRYEDWVEVTTNDKNLDYGWIHQEFLVTAAGGTLDTTDDKQYAQFRSQFILFLNNYEKTGMSPFTGVELLEPGALQITAHKDWFALEQKQRNTILTEVYDLWKKYVEPGKSAFIEVVDEKGEQHMMMFR